MTYSARQLLLLTYLSVAFTTTAAVAQPLASGPAPVATPGVVDVAPAIPAPDPYTWRGREREIEEFLRTAPITRMTDIPVGITKPQRAYFAPGGLAGSMAWKPLGDQLLHGKMESYRSEIAAYLMSRHLGLELVPPVVEREIKGARGAAVYWIDGVRPWDPKTPPKVSGANWARQMSRMLMFDQLIANIDRNQGNLLYNDGGHIFLIDHSRAFTSKPDLSGLHGPGQFDRELWARMAALTRDDLDRVVGEWLRPAQIEALLERRDAMARHIERQVRERGERATFLPRASQPVAASSR
jgi:hypothetical protein